MKRSDFLEDGAVVGVAMDGETHRMNPSGDLEAEDGGGELGGAGLFVSCRNHHQTTMRGKKGGGSCQVETGPARPVWAQ